MKRIIVSSIVGGALALGLLSGQVSAATAPATATQVERPGPGGGPRGGQHGPADTVGSLIKATADATGLTNIQVMAELQNGKSLTQIAQSKGKTAAEIIAAARATLKTRLDQQVANGRLTQVKADEALAKFDTEAPTVMADTTLGEDIGKGPEKAAAIATSRELIKGTADATGLTNIQVMAELQSGKSLAQVAQAKGKASADIIAAVRAEAKTRLDKAVAAGRLTQAKADEALATFDTEAPKVMADTTLGTQIGNGRRGR